MSGSRLPPLRPLAGEPAELGSEPGSSAGGRGAGAGEQAPPLPWEQGDGRSAVETELSAFCEAGELVYAAVVGIRGGIEAAVCTVGARPHNEGQIGALVARFSETAATLGAEVGEKEPLGLNLQGSRWSYSLEPLSGERVLFGIHSSQALPAIVRACARKSRVALEAAPEKMPAGEG